MLVSVFATGAISVLLIKCLHDASTFVHPSALHKLRVHVAHFTIKNKIENKVIFVSVEQRKAVDAKRLSVKKVKSPP